MFVNLLFFGNCCVCSDKAMESDDTFVFYKPELVRNYLDSFESMRKKDELCDVVFKAGNVPISAHRVILAAGIPYFKNLFTETDAENKTLEIDCDPEALELLINFVYTGKVEISAENMLPLYSASIFLGMSDVQEACYQFISKKLIVENVMKVRKLGEGLNSEALVKQADNYIVEHFVEFSRTADFLAMPFSDVEKLICDDYLGVESEEDVFEAVMRWVDSLESERQAALLPRLLKAVRMTQLSPAYLLGTVSTNEGIRASSVCRDLLDEVMFYMLLPDKRHLFRGFSTSARHSYKKIFAVCTTKFGCSVKLYDIRSNEWSLLGTNDMPDHFVDVFVRNDKMLLFGGKNFGSFDLKNYRWDKMEHMHEHTCGGGIVLHCDKIYVFGSSLYDSSREVFCYDIFQDIWRKEGSMIEHRSRPGVVSMGESIYIVGGYPDGVAWYSDVHNSVERYDPQERMSQSLSPLLLRRYWFGICALNDTIYVCGGCNEHKQPFSSSEVFDPKTNQWSWICPMFTSRYSVSLILNDKKLYAVGGKVSRGKSTNKVEIYDPESNLWTAGEPLDIENDALISLRACAN